MPTVLIVEDNSFSRRLFRVLFEGKGHLVHEAGSFAQASAKLELHDFALVVTDFQLGEDRTGLCLLKHLQSMPSPPVAIMVSGT